MGKVARWGCGILLFPILFSIVNEIIRICWVWVIP